MPETNTPKDEFNRFESALRKVLSVPKEPGKQKPKKPKPKKPNKKKS